MLTSLVDCRGAIDTRILGELEEEIVGGWRMYRNGSHEGPAETTGRGHLYRSAVGVLKGLGASKEHGILRPLGTWAEHLGCPHEIDARSAATFCFHAFTIVHVGTLRRSCCSNGNERN